MNFKDVVLSSWSFQNNEGSPFGTSSVPNESATPVVIAFGATLVDCLHDPPIDVAFPEVVVVDELSQV